MKATSSQEREFDLKLNLEELLLLNSKKLKGEIQIFYKDKSSQARPLELSIGDTEKDNFLSLVKLPEDTDEIEKYKIILSKEGYQDLTTKQDKLSQKIEPGIRVSIYGPSYQH